MVFLYVIGFAARAPELDLLPADIQTRRRCDQASEIIGEDLSSLPPFMLTFNTARLAPGEMCPRRRR